MVLFVCLKIANIFGGGTTDRNCGQKITGGTISKIAMFWYLRPSHSGNILFPSLKHGFGERPGLFVSCIDKRASGLFA
jgi:hypothetical protein